MVSEEIADFIREGLYQRVPLEDLKDDLIKQGWAIGRVEEAARQFEDGKFDSSLEEEKVSFGGMLVSKKIVNNIFYVCSAFGFLQFLFILIFYGNIISKIPSEFGSYIAVVLIGGMSFSVIYATMCFFLARLDPDFRNWVRESFVVMSWILFGFIVFFFIAMLVSFRIWIALALFLNFIFIGVVLWNFKFRDNFVRFLGENGKS